MAMTHEDRWFSLSRFKFGERITGQPVTLTHRRIFILPTSRGLGSAVLLAIMLTASTVYGNNLGFILTFLLAGIVVVSILHSFRSLVGLRFRSNPCAAVFAGEQAAFDCQIENPSHYPRVSLWLNTQYATPIRIDLASHTMDHAQLLIRTSKRGWHVVRTVTLYCYFPIGLFRAWSPINLSQKILVYPAPTLASLSLPIAYRSTPDSGKEFSGDDNFAGFQQYQPGDSVRRIYWKAVAKEQGLHTKFYDSDQTAVIWLDWARTPGGSDEEKLSQLSRWVLDAEQTGSLYGLRLPSLKIEPGRGEVHRSQSLEALALFGNEKDPIL